MFNFPAPNFIRILFRFVVLWALIKCEQVVNSKKESHEMHKIHFSYTNVTNMAIHG